jgi:hypothetical protein
VLDVVLGGCDKLLDGVTSFLIITVIIGHDNDASGVLLWPLLGTIGAFASTLNSGFGRWCSAATRGRFCVAQDEGGLDHLLTRGVSGGDVEQFFDGFWLITGEPMY